MLTTPALMNSALTPAGVFFVMSVLSFFAAGFIYYWIRETRGLTDKEKRSIFQDKQIENSKVDHSEFGLVKDTGIN